VSRESRLDQRSDAVETGASIAVAGGLLAANAILSSALDAVPDAIHVVDDELRVLYFSRGFTEWCHRLGVELTDPPGQHLGDLFPFLPESVWREYADVLRSGEILVTEEVAEPAGVPVPALVRKIPVLEHGRVVRIVTIVHDLTEDLRRNEAQGFTQFAIEHTGDAAYWVGPDAKFTYVNAQASRMLGYTREELLDMTVHDIDPAFTPEVWPAHWQDLQRRGSFTLETSHRRKDGSLCPVEMLGNYIRLGDRERNCAFARDITQRKQAEASLRESEERLELALKGAEVGLWDWRPATGELVVDGRWARMLGYTPEELEPRLTGWAALLHPDERTASLAALREHAASGRPFEMEIRMRAKSGEWRWILVRGRVVERDKDGKPLRVAGTPLDITDRKRADHLLHMTQFAVDHSPDAAYWIGEDGGILYANEQACRMTGYSREELLTMSVLDLDPAYTRENWNAYVRETLAMHSDAFETVHRAKDGSRVAVEVALNALRFEAKQYYCIFVRDIRERKRQEEEQRLVERALQRAEHRESLAELAGGVAHDFNNLLMGILGNAELARGKSGTEAVVARHLDAIETSARRAADLARQMLAFAGRASLAAYPTDLSACVRDLLELAQAAVRKGARLEADLAAGLPLALLDSVQIGHLLLDLVSNASEALAETGGVITIRTAAIAATAEDFRDTWYADYDLAPGRYVTLTVSDNGCGMDEPTRARVFEPFFSTKFAGRGLGMPSVLGTVRAHHGAIRLDTEPGLGTVVTVFLPICPDSRQVAPTSGDRAAVAAWPSTGAVLVIDDDPAVRAIAGEALESAGFTVLYAEDGASGIEALRNAAGGVRLVLADLTMPGPDGARVARFVAETRPGVPVLLSSGYSEAEAREQLGETAIAGFLAKPYLPSELLALARRVLGE